jgi:serine/threonine-protein kinase
MGTVLLAQDLRHQRRVALKVLRPDIRVALGAERFERETLLAARLEHPNILPVFDSGETAGFRWFSMPYVEGESLRQRLDREGQLPVPEALRLACEALRALQYAHDHGVVHRDIKPGNLLLVADGTLLLADFGIARPMEARRRRLTLPGLAIGTPEYMSPEQGAGDERVDGRSDIYSLACVLYEMLTGEPPYTAPTPEAVIAKHREAPIPDARLLRRTVSRGLNRSLTKALAKAPADRYEAAAAFAEELGRLAAEPGPGTILRRGGAAGLWIIAGLVAATGVARWYWSSRGRMLDPHHVVIFSITPAGATDSALAAGITEALLSAMNSTASITGVDGRRLGTTGSDARRSARAGAGHFLTGTLLASDSLRLRFELHSTVGDTTVIRTLAFPGAASAWEIGLQVARRALPLLFAAARLPDLPLLERLSPDALAEFFQGEQRYRQSAFTEALKHYSRAVEADSGFALAALHGARAATWTDQPGRTDLARSLVTIALRHAADLPPRFRGEAEGLDAYLQGRADSAVRVLRRVLREGGESPEAWMLLGETYNHFLPTGGQPDSLAEDAFERTRELDSTLTPVLFHLIEFAARRRDTAEVRRGLRLLRSSDAGSIELGAAALVERCAARPLAPAEWREAVRRSPSAVRGAAQSLSVAGLRLPLCALGGWQALVDNDTARHDAESARRRFGARLALQNILVAEGRDAEVTALWRSDTLFNLGYAEEVLVFDALATGRFRSHADSFAVARFAKLAARDSVASLDLWLAGSWVARRGGSLIEARRAAQTLAGRAERGGRRQDTLFARSMAAQLALGQGDTAGAVAQFRLLQPTAGQADLIAWRPWESLGYERLLLLELLVSQRRFPEALDLAAAFDSPAPLIYAIYLPAVLRLRLRAAEAWQEQALVRRCRARLLELEPTRME